MWPSSPFWIFLCCRKASLVSSRRAAEGVYCIFFSRSLISWKRLSNFLLRSLFNLDENWIKIPLIYALWVFHKVKLLCVEGALIKKNSEKLLVLKICKEKQIFFHTNGAGCGWARRIVRWVGAWSGRDIVPISHLSTHRDLLETSILEKNLCTGE